VARRLRTEMVESIISVRIAFEIALSVVTGIGARR
jgi:hypothetical protein